MFGRLEINNSQLFKDNSVSKSSLVFCVSKQGKHFPCVPNHYRLFLILLSVS